MTWHSALLIAAICALVYLLYRRGIVMTKCIRAVLFVFRAKRDRDSVSLNACTGWVCHVGQFRESRAYEFRLEDRLSKGTAEAVLLDAQKRELLRLNRQKAVGQATLCRGSRYYLCWEFQGATGKCELCW